MSKKMITVEEFAENLDRFRIPLSSMEREKRKGNIPYYGAAKVIDYVDDFTHSGLAVLIAEDGSVETSDGFPVLQLADGKYWVNNHTHVLKGIDDYETKYLYYALHTIKVAPFVTGAVQKKISQKALNSMSFPYFDEKQVRENIVDILLAFDDKIQLNTQINQTLEQIAQAIFKSWFIDFDPVKAKAEVKAQGSTDEQANIAAMSVISGKSPDQLNAYQQTNPTDYQQLHQLAQAFPSEFEEIDGMEVPKGWGGSSIGECYCVELGQSPKGETYNETGNGKLFYQGRAEFGWRFPKPRLYTTEPKKFAQKGDVLMSVRAPVGDMNIAIDACCIGRGLCALRHKSGFISFGIYQLQSIKPVFDVFNGEGTVFGSINQKDLKALPVIKPKLDIIERFSHLIQPYDEIIENLSRKI